MDAENYWLHKKNQIPEGLIGYVIKYKDLPGSKGSTFEFVIKENVGVELFDDLAKNYEIEIIPVHEKQPVVDKNKLTDIYEECYQYVKKLKEEYENNLNEAYKCLSEEVEREKVKLRNIHISDYMPITLNEVKQEISRNLIFATRVGKSIEEAKKHNESVYLSPLNLNPLTEEELKELKTEWRELPRSEFPNSQTLCNFGSINPIVTITNNL